MAHPPEWPRSKPRPQAPLARLGRALTRLAGGRCSAVEPAFIKENYHTKRYMHLPPNQPSRFQNLPQRCTSHDVETHTHRSLIAPWSVIADYSTRRGGVNRLRHLYPAEDRTAAQKNEQALDARIQSDFQEMLPTLNITVHALPSG